MGISKKAIVEGDDILQYIPQRAPIVMVDKFFGVKDELSVSGLTVKKDNIFCKDGYFQDSGLIEHIAQSAAIRTGYIFITKGEEVPVGFIGSVNNLTINELPRVGDELTTEVRVETEVFGITLLSATVKVDTSIVAECQMKVALSTQN